MFATYIKCFACGADLKVSDVAVMMCAVNAPIVMVEPCVKCLETAKEEGRNETGDLAKAIFLGGADA